MTPHDTFYSLVGLVVGGFLIQEGGSPGAASISEAKNSAMAVGSRVNSLAASFDTVCLRLQIQRSLKTNQNETIKHSNAWSVSETYLGFVLSGTFELTVFPDCALPR
jgi:hypothetical protein